MRLNKIGGLKAGGGGQHTVLVAFVATLLPCTLSLLLCILSEYLLLKGIGLRKHAGQHGLPPPH